MRGLGKIHFVLTYIFFNGAFFPMHFLGASAAICGGFITRCSMSLSNRCRIGMFSLLVSALILGASQIFFLYNFLESVCRKESGKNSVASQYSGMDCSFTTATR